MRRAISAAAVMLLLAGRAYASPATLQVDPSRSNISTTLCMTVCGTQCSTSASPVSGTIEIGFDCLTQQADLVLYNFDFLLNNSIQWHLNFGLICGRFDSTASNLGLHYGTPGTPMPPATLVGGAFNYTGVPATATGTMTYTTTNLVCAAFQAAGRLCSDAIDLSTLSVGPIDMTGSVQVTGRAVTLTLNVNSSGPIDPNNPGLGTLSIVGTVVATGTVPLPDVATFAAVLLGENTNLDVVCESDINQDGVTDGGDIQAYINAVLAP